MDDGFYGIQVISRVHRNLCIAENRAFRKLHRNIIGIDSCFFGNGASHCHLGLRNLLRIILELFIVHTM
jgi:hypothetical protein